MDVDPATLGNCALEGLPRQDPQPGDVVVIAKKFMGDSMPYKACVLLTAQEASSIRLGLQQPSGVSARRPIMEPVIKNIETYAPRCLAQGMITAEGADYLKCWSKGTLPKEPRPVVYSFLNFRQKTPCAYTGESVIPRLTAPVSKRHVSLATARHECESSDENEEQDAICVDD